jgi:WXG100 family type VII secretion target
MSFSYDADLELASRVVATLSSVEEHLDEVVADLRWRVAHLHSSWEGLTSLAHVDAHGSWESSYGEMRSALALMREAVQTAAANYSAAASANTQMWSALR